MNYRAAIASALNNLLALGRRPDEQRLRRLARAAARPGPAVEAGWRELAGMGVYRPAGLFGAFSGLLR